MLAGKILVQNSNQISEIDHFNFIKNGRIFFIEVNVHKKIKNLLKKSFVKKTLSFTAALDHTPTFYNKVW